MGVKVPNDHKLPPDIDVSSLVLLVRQLWGANYWNGIGVGNGLLVLST